jgi:hypothetical protein
VISFFPFAVGQIIGHSPFNVVPLTIKVALCLEYCTPDESVEAAMYLRYATLKVQGAEFNREFLDQ